MQLHIFETAPFRRIYEILVSKGIKWQWPNGKVILLYLIIARFLETLRAANDVAKM